MAKVMGRAYITTNGKRLNSKEGATLDYGGISRAPVVGDSGVAGSQETITAPQIDCTIIASSDIKLAEIQAIDDATISFDTDDGRSYVITGGFSGPAPKLSKDGIVAVFYGIDCKEA